MTTSKVISIRITRNSITTFIKDIHVTYSVERTWREDQKTYYEFKRMVIPSWAKHLEKDIENYLGYNMEKVDGLWYNDVLEIQV